VVLKRVLLTVPYLRRFLNAYHHRLTTFIAIVNLSRRTILISSDVSQATVPLSQQTHLQPRSSFGFVHVDHEVLPWTSCAPHIRRSPPFRAEVRACRHDSVVYSPCLFSPLLHYGGVACPPQNFLILFLLIIIFEAANTCLQQSWPNLIGLDTHASFLAQSQWAADPWVLFSSLQCHVVKQVLHLIGRNRDHYSSQFPSRQDNRLRDDYQGSIPEASNGQASTIACHGNACVRRSRLVTVQGHFQKRVCHAFKYPIAGNLVSRLPSETTCDGGLESA